MKNVSYRTRKALKVTWIGFVWNIILTLFKIIAGIFGRSNALIADAIHSMSDFATDLAVLTGLKIAGKPVDDTHSYGHGKFETLSTIVISISLFIVGIGILWSGLVNIFDVLNGQILEKPGWIALIAVFSSIVIKEFLYRYTIKIGKNINSQPLIANAWHHRSDALSSVAVMTGIGGAIFLGEKWTVLDPIAAVIVSLLILRVALSTSSGSINELLDASLSKERRKEILKIVKDVPGANNPHNLKTRKIGNNIAIDMHIKVNRTLSIVEAHDISTKVEDRLKDSFGSDTFISIHVEPEDLDGRDMAGEK